MTIVVLLILAGVSISTVLGNNGIIPRANEAKFKTDLANIQEEFKLYVMDKTIENGDFSVGTLNASANLLTYNTQPDEEKGTGNISSVLKSGTAQKYVQNKNFSIIKGDLIYASKNAKELEWAQEIGLAINPYNIDENGVLLSSETNLMLMDQVTGTVVIPEMVTAIGEGTFANVKGLKRIVILPTVNEIKANAFRGNTEIEEVIIQANEEKGLGVAKIGDFAFQGCQKLTKMDLPNTVTSLGIGVFYRCTELQEVTLSANLKHITRDTFATCYKLKSIDIPEGITSIGNRSFSQTRLNEITIPASLKEIEDGVFYGVRTIQNVNINEENNSFIYINGILLTKDGQEMKLVTNSAIKGNTFIIPEGVTVFPDGAIIDYSGVTKVIMPSSVRSIYPEAIGLNVYQFEIDENNPHLTVINGGIYSKDKTTLWCYFANNSEVTISEGTKTIESKAIRKGTNFVFPDSLEVIKNYGLSGLTANNIKFGKNLKSISGVSIYDSSIKNIEISEENPNFMSEGCAIYNKDKTRIIIHGDGSVSEFSVPSGVKTIGAGCFQYHRQLSKIQIPNTVENIETAVFSGDGNMKKIEIPSSVIYIAPGAFSGAGGLEEVIIDKEKGSIAGSPWGGVIGERAIKWLK